MSTLIKEIKITIGGKSYHDDYNFLNIECKQELLKPNEFRFTMQKRNSFKMLSDVQFDFPKQLIGKEVKCVIITERFNEEAMRKSEEFEFNGIIFDIGVSRKELIADILIHVTAYSYDYLLMDNKHCRAYKKRSLQVLVEATIAPYDFPKIIKPKFTTEIPYSVQYQETNYEYLVRLARRYGEWLYNDGKEFVFGKMKDLGDSLELYATTDILNYRYDGKITHDKFTHYCLDVFKDPAFMKKTPNEVDTSLSNGLFTDELKEQSKALYKKETLQVLHCAIPEENESDELEVSVKAQYMGDKAEISVCSGASVRADMRIGTYFIIRDFYDKNNNKTDPFDHDDLVVIQITHKFEQNGFYENEFKAISGECEYPPYHNSDVFPVAHSQIGIVADNKDPEKLGRVSVGFPWQGKSFTENTSPWIQVVPPYICNDSEKGFYFIPEIDEIVMVGFVHGNAEKPFVIGSIRDSIKVPDKKKWYSDTNDVKAIRTRNGHTIEFHDKGKGGCIRIYSPGNIELYAGYDIIMKAKHNIIQKADNDIEMEAKNDIIIEAENNFYASGKTSAYLNSPNIAQVQSESEANLTSGGTVNVGGMIAKVTIKGLKVDIN